MKFWFKKILASLASGSVLLLVACGGGGSSGTTTTSTSSVNLASNCQTTTVPLDGNGLPPGLTALRTMPGVTSVTVSGSNVVIRTTAVPNHPSPYCASGGGVCTNESTGLQSPSYYSAGNFSLNPNTISAQNYVLTIPKQPSCATASTDTSSDAIGVAANGIVFFNQYAAANAALTGEIATFDRYGGHPAQQGNYHYHMEPRYLTTTSVILNSSGSQSALIGWALDGFPVYGPTNSSGAALSLDSCHGEHHATTEYPSGIYHYHVTSTSPYLVGCYAGTPGTKSN